VCEQLFAAVENRLQCRMAVAVPMRRWLRYPGRSFLERVTQAASWFPRRARRPASSGRREPTTVSDRVALAPALGSSLSQQSRAPARTRSVPAERAAWPQLLVRVFLDCTSGALHVPHDIMMLQTPRPESEQGVRVVERGCVHRAGGRFAIWLPGGTFRQNSGHCRDPHLGLSPDNLGRPKRTWNLARKRSAKAVLTQLRDVGQGLVSRW